jgi:phosphate transport system substrate-binding protein
MNKTILITLAALLIAPIGYSQRLIIKGSDTLGAKAVPTLAEEYKTINKNVSFEIAAEGSSTGIAAIIDGTANIGMSSRRAKPTEVSSATSKGVTLKPIIVAHDAIAIIVNENNPITKLTKRQVQQIFTGDVVDWSGVGGKQGKISVYTRNTSSGTYTDFKELAMSKRDYVGSSQKLAGNEQIVGEVQKNPNAVGYVGLAYINSPNIKVIAIDGQTPSKESIVKHLYPYARPTFYYVNGSPSGEAEKFIEFTLSPKGKEIIEKVGFVAPE